MPAEARQLENPAHRFQRLKGTAAFTIATRSYLPYVQVLMGSLREFHPDFELICLLVDEDTSKDRDGVGNGCEMQPHWMVLRAAELGIRNFDDMTWRYDTTELCTALKPMFFSWLLQHTAVQCIYYLDPDIRLFAPMTESQDFLRRGAPMILTPHLTEPLQGDSEPSTHTILKSGCFNLGFAAVRRDPRSTAFVDWWAERLRTDAVIDFAANRFTDQRWCDMAPCFVPGLEILRHPGYNVAYWNLVHRRLCRDSFGKWSVDAKNLVFFHFSGVDPRFPEQVSKYQDRLHWKELGDCQTLFEDYIADLLAANWEVASRDPRPYYFQDGVDISQTMRCIYRDLHGQPPEMSRQEILVEMLQLCLTSAEPSASSPADLSALMRWLHARRTDLQVTFNLADAQGARDYCAWFWSSGVIEHGLNSLLHRAAQQPQQQSASDHGR